MESKGDVHYVVKTSNGSLLLTTDKKVFIDLVNSSNEITFKKFKSESEAKIYMNEIKNSKEFLHKKESKDKIEKPKKPVKIEKGESSDDSNKKNFIVVYTDGACSNNGKPNAKAGYGVYWPDEQFENISEKLKGDIQTNQRAELTAILKAVKVYLNNENKKKLLIKTDSKYSIDCITKWSANWERNGWKTSDGNDVKNVDLIKPLNLLYKKDLFILEHISGHSGVDGNEKADQLARKAIKS